MSAKGFVAVALLFKSLGEKNGHHQNYDIFSREFRPKPAFATSALWVGGLYPKYIIANKILRKYQKLPAFPISSLFSGWRPQIEAEHFARSTFPFKPWQDLEQPDVDC